MYKKLEMRCFVPLLGLLLRYWNNMYDYDSSTLKIREISSFFNCIKSHIKLVKWILCKIFLKYALLVAVKAVAMVTDPYFIWIVWTDQYEVEVYQVKLTKANKIFIITLYAKHLTTLFMIWIYYPIKLYNLHCY